VEGWRGWGGGRGGEGRGGRWWWWKERDLFVFNDTIEEPRAPAGKQKEGVSKRREKSSAKEV
jgi:hypothetical protein